MADTTETDGNNCSVKEHNVSTFLASLYSNPQVPRNIVQTIVDDMSLLFDGIHHTLKSSISKLRLDGSISNENFDNLNSMLEHPFHDLNTLLN